jgi:hypothetical protein
MSNKTRTSRLGDPNTYKLHATLCHVCRHLKNSESFRTAPFLTADIMSIDHPARQTLFCFVLSVLRLVGIATTEQTTKQSCCAGVYRHGKSPDASRTDPPKPRIRSGLPTCGNNRCITSESACSAINKRSFVQRSNFFNAQRILSRSLMIAGFYAKLCTV